MKAMPAIIRRFFTIKRWWAALFLIIVAVSTVLADGDCPERKANASEAAQYNVLQSAIKAALPAPPENYKADFSRLDHQLIICASHPADKMWSMYFSVDYTSALGEKRDKQFRSTMMEKMKGTPQQQERLAALDAREAALTKARKNADSRDEKDRIKAELKAVRAEARNLQNEISSQYQSWVQQGALATAMKNNKEPDLPRLNVSINVNRKAYIPGHAKPFKVNGASQAFEYGDSASHTITVLIGRYHKDSGELLNTAGGLSTKARGIAVSFHGPANSTQGLRDLVGRTDIAKLNTLLR